MNHEDASVADAVSPLEREAAEDDEDAGRRAVAALALGSTDAVVLVSAGGRSPFVLGAAKSAGAVGAFTACVVSVPASELAPLCDAAICAIVGPELVDVAPANEKLRARVRHIVGEATGAPEEEVARALAEAGGEAKVAIVSLLTGVDAEHARARLAAAGGNVRLALVG